VHEGRLVLDLHPAVEEVDDAAGEPRGGVLRRQVAARLGEDGGDLPFEHDPPLGGGDAHPSRLEHPAPVAEGTQRRVTFGRAREERVVPPALEVEARQLVVDVRDEPHVGVSRDELGDEGGSASTAP
jgi:hypothetical protein